MVPGDERRGAAVPACEQLPPGPVRRHARLQSQPNQAVHQGGRSQAQVPNLTSNWDIATNFLTLRYTAPPKAICTIIDEMIFLKIINHKKKSYFYYLKIG